MKKIKKQKLLLILGLLASLPMVGRAQVIYSDSFEAGNSNGWTLSGAGLQYPPYVSPTDVGLVGTATSTGMGYVTYTNLNGNHAFYVVSQGNASSTPNSGGPQVPGNDQTDFKNANVGSTFAANTTYTLTYLLASRNLFGGSAQGSFTISLEGNGAVIGASSQNSTPLQDGNFFAGPTVSIDTASHAGLIGQNIGIDAGWLNTSEAFTSVGWDNFVLTATADSVPEPSAYALMGFGLLGLAMLVRRKASAV